MMDKRKTAPSDCNGKSGEEYYSNDNQNINNSQTSGKSTMPTNLELAKCKTTLEKALLYAGKGYAIFPCKEKGNKAKAPYTDRGFYDATTDEAQIRVWWTRYPSALIGLPTGSDNGLIVVDLDIRDDGDGVENFKQFLHEHEITIDHLPPKAITQSDSFHLFFLYPDRQDRHKGKLCDFVDIKGRGGYTIAPGSIMATGEAYRWELDRDPTNTPLLPLPPVLEGLVFRCQSTNKKSNGPPHQEQNYRNKAIEIKTIREATFAIPSDDREIWLKVGMALKIQFGESGFAIWREWSRQSNKFNEQDSWRVWSSFKREGIGIGTLLELAQQHGWTQKHKVSSGQKSTETDKTDTFSSKPWGKPEPLYKPLAAKPYPREALPSGIQNAIDVVNAFVQSPYALTATVALGALSAAASHISDVQRASRLRSSTALYLLMIAQSGERKTTLEGIFNKAIIEWQRKKEKGLQQEIKEKKAESAAWKAKRLGILSRIKAKSKKGEPVVEDENELTKHEKKFIAVPKPPQILHDEINRETLGPKLAQEHPISAIMVGEGGSFFGSYGMTKEKLMDYLAFLNKMWSGETAGSERKTVESYKIERANVTLSLQVQGTVFQDFLERGHDVTQGIGFFARTLFLHPETTIGQRPFVEPGNWDPVTAFSDRLTELLDTPLTKDDNGILTPDLLSFDNDGRQAWINYHDKIERAMAPTEWLGNWTEFANKAAENVARLAALLHLFTTGPYGDISKETLNKAAKIVDWHISDSRSIFWWSGYV